MSTEPLPEPDDPARYGHPRIGDSTWRTDPGAREAVEQVASGWLGDLPADALDAPDVPPSPDCVAGKHLACVGDSWSEADDMPADCPCDCHDLPAVVQP